MRNLVIRALPALLAFSVGLGFTFLLTWDTSQWLYTPANRSCQVKRVRANGDVVWTPCPAWG